MGHKASKNKKKKTLKDEREEEHPKQNNEIDALNAVHSQIMLTNGGKMNEKKISKNQSELKIIAQCTGIWYFQLKTIEFLLSFSLIASRLDYDDYLKQIHGMKN